MHRQYVHRGSRTLAYLDSAPGARAAEIVMLVHAFPLSAAMWEGQAQALPPGWRLIAPDLRGFGGSTMQNPEDAPDIDEYADDVIDLLRELGVAQAVVGGLSMGGYVTFGVLRRAPGLVRAVVLADTRAGADTPEGREKRRSMLALLDREGPAGVALDMIPKLLGSSTRAHRAEVELLVRRLIKQQSSSAIRGAILRMMTRPDSTAVLERLDVPTLIVAGEQDVLTTPDDSRRMAATVSQAELVLIPEAGHLANLEQRDAFNRALGAFLSRL
jgi:3-oxoadipate enol-lactonase